MLLLLLLLLWSFFAFPVVVTCMSVCVLLLRGRSEARHALRHQGAEGWKLWLFISWCFSFTARPGRKRWETSLLLRPRFCVFVAVAETVLSWRELEDAAPDGEAGVAGWVKVSSWLSLLLMLGALLFSLV